MLWQGRIGVWFGKRRVVVRWYLRKVESWLNKVQRHAKSDTYKTQRGMVCKKKGRLVVKQSWGK